MNRQRVRKLPYETENGISVSSVQSYIIYYGLVANVIILALRQFYLMK